jgi:hypothetical protein
MYDDPQGCGNSASRVKDDIVSFMGLTQCEL